MTPLRTLAVGAVLCGAAVISTLPASAQDVPQDEPTSVGDGCVPAERLDAARARILRGIDARLRRVDRLETAVGRAEALTDTHRSTIGDTLSSTASGLTDLRGTVEAETDGCALADEAHAVVEDFRVYVIVTPQTRLTIGGDRIAGAEDRLDAIEVRLSDAIDAAEAGGQDVTEARNDLATYRAEADAAIAAAEPVGDAVLALAPADWPDPASDTLEAARDDLRGAIGHLRAARAAAVEVRDDLA